MCSSVVFRIIATIFMLVSLVKQISSELDLTYVESSKIIYPEVVEKFTRRCGDKYSNVHNSENNEIKLIKVADWNLVLNSNSEGKFVVAPGLRTNWIDSNGTSSLKQIQKCDYKIGVVRGLETISSVAVTVCGFSIIAYINIKGVIYFLHPLNDNSKAHILYRSKINYSRIKRSKLTENVYATELETAPQWMFNLTGDTIDIGDNEGTEFEQNFNGDLTRENEDTYERNVTQSSSFSAEILDPFSKQQWYREQLDYLEGGYSYDSAWTANTLLTRTHGSPILPKRWLEIAIAVDNTLISFHGRDKVEQYVLALLNIVNVIYQDSSLEANMKLVVTRLIMYEHKKHVIRPGNAKKSLENVNGWNRRLHSSLPSGEPHHDLAIWLTRSDIGGPSGYAPVAGVCDPKRSCALNRDEGLTSAFIIAHETAHILGLSHDGDRKNGNNCSDEALAGSVMAPMVAATFSKFSWSECSKREFRSVASKWTCLLNSPTEENEIFLNGTFQTSFTMDEQCRMEFGDGYYMCRAFEIIDPCSHLWCGHEKSPLVCKTKKGPPLEGTECGFGKWCVNGFCQELDSNQMDSVPVVLNPQDGGWSNWEPWGACSRTCGTGVQFKSRKCNNPKPTYGGRPCLGEQEVWRVCNRISCPGPLVDIRAQQCKQLPKYFNFTRKLNENLSWYPYESEDFNKKCKYICINTEGKEVYIANENLLDGTPCSYENPDDICVKGICQPLGCDGILHSKLRRDKCGTCNGNNSECLEIKFSFDRKLKKEVSRVSVLPRMARTIKVDVNVKTHYSKNLSVAFVLKNLRKKKFVVIIPTVAVHTKIIEGAKFLFNKNNYKQSLWTKGPIYEETVILVVIPSNKVKSGINISYNVEYSIHKIFFKRSKRYMWIMGGWGPCSASCGGGRRQKTTACWDNKKNKVVKRTFCSLLQKPKLQTEKCNTFGCSFQWLAGKWEPCTNSCGTSGIQYRELYCVPNLVLNTILFSFNGTVISDPWSYMTSPNKCSGTKPPSVRSCNRKPCFSYWTFGEWSKCSALCGEGLQSRSSYCPPPVDEIFYTCGELPPIQKRTCMGYYTRHTNPLCKGRKRKVCKEDNSRYCSFILFHKYCKLSGFRRLCCKSCANFHLRTSQYITTMI